MAEQKKHFVLVHGAGLGAWCWYKVATLLSADGHRVTTVDLGASGINPKQLDDIPTFSGYLQPLTEVMAALPSDEKIILVGHSYGGIVISVAMEKFPQKVAVGIYVTAFMPDPSFNILELNQQYFTDLDFYGDSTFIFGLGQNNPATAVLFGPTFVASVFYNRSPPEDLTLGLTLLRFFPLYRDEISKEEASLSVENYGSVHRAYIVCTDDLVLPEASQRGFIQNYPPDLVREISGSDHLVMNSQPTELSATLVEIAGNY